MKIILNIETNIIVLQNITEDITPLLMFLDSI